MTSEKKKAIAYRVLRIVIGLEFLAVPVGMTLIMQKLFDRHISSPPVLPWFFEKIFWTDPVLRTGVLLHFLEITPLVLIGVYLIVAREPKVRWLCLALLFVGLLIGWDLFVFSHGEFAVPPALGAHKAKTWMHVTYACLLLVLLASERKRFAAHGTAA